MTGVVVVVGPQFYHILVCRLFITSSRCSNFLYTDKMIVMVFPGSWNVSISALHKPRGDPEILRWKLLERGRIGRHEDKSLYLFCETRAEKISRKERRRKNRQKGKEWLFSLSINLLIIIVIIYLS